MKDGHVPHNKIIPVRSLVESTKNGPKRQYLNFAAKGSQNGQGELISTPRSTGGQSHSPHIPFERFEDSGHGYREEKPKGIRGNGGHINQVHFGQQKQSVGDKGYRTYQEIYYSTKPQRQIKPEHLNTVKYTHFNPQRSHKESSAEGTPRKYKAEDSQEKFKVNMNFNEKVQSFKSMSLNRGSSESKDNSFVSSGKFEDETWNVSKFEMMFPPEKEPPLFKNDLNKIKTDLFQKEAQLFELSQKLQKREQTIKDLTTRLQIANDLNHTLKVKMSQDGDKQKLKLTIEMERLLQKVAKLTAELNSSRYNHEKEQQNSLTNKKLLMLKLRQYELDQKEKTQYIIELKQKEKKNIENYQKIINGQKELLRQKQSQLTKLNQAAQFYKDQVSANIQTIQDLNRNSIGKEEVIRQLSGEVSDLKTSLNELQTRLREMIQNQEYLKEETVAKLKEDNQNLLKKVNDLSQQKFNESPQEKKQNSVNEFQLSMMEKTCEEYKRKIDEYHKYSEEMRLEIIGFKKMQSQLRKVISEKDFDNLKYKSSELVSKKIISPRKSVSPLKQVQIDEKQFQKMKQLNIKLFKDNERLSRMIKDLNAKIIIFYKLNKDLNEIIVIKDLQKLNDCMTKWSLEE